jgi:hypothetical protein
MGEVSAELTDASLRACDGSFLFDLSQCFIGGHTAGPPKQNSVGLLFFSVTTSQYSRDSAACLIFAEQRVAKSRAGGQREPFLICIKLFVRDAMLDCS